MVTYLMEQEPGATLWERYKVRLMPTLLVLDPGGKEVDRQEGYPGLERTLEWLKEAPAKGMSVDDLVVDAKKRPKEIGVQLAAARRLAAHGRVAEARPFWKRAESGDAATAAAALWERARAEEQASVEAARLKVAEAVARKDPASPAAVQALRVMATASKPPVATVNKVVDARMEKTGEDWRALTELAYLALRAGALDAAAKVAAKIEQKADTTENAEMVRAAAEVANARGETEKAVALGKRAADVGPSIVRRDILGHVKRFERGGREPAPELAKLDAAWAVGTDRVPFGRYMSGGSRALSKMFREAPEKCTALAAGLTRLSATAVVGSEPSDVRVFSDRGPLPKPLAECLARLIAEGEPSPGEMLNFGLSLETKDQRAAFDKLSRAAEAKCSGDAGKPGRPVSFEGFLSVEAPAKAVVALGAGPKPLEACLEKFFTAAKLKPGTTRQVRFTFNRRSPLPKGDAAAAN